MPEGLVTENIQTLQKLVNTLIEFCVNYSFQILGAVIVLIVGFIAANWAARLTMRLCESRKADVTLSRFTASGVKICVLGFAAVIALGKFGITIAPLVAALGAVAFGASLAIQGPLSNYGAGLTIIMARPFTVGDTITIKGVSGVVDEVRLAYTFLVDEDGVRITVPNKDIVGQVLRNSGKHKIVEGAIGVSYGDPADKAVETVRKALSGCREVASEPGPQVGIQEFADSSVNIGFRYWVPTIKYYQSAYSVNAAVYRAVQEAGLNIPFPQRDVHVVGAGAAQKDSASLS